MRHKRIRGQNESGQGLLEAVIACGIITTALAATLTLVSGSINAEKQSEFSIVAANLAREGIEVIRNIRDSNWLAGAPWDRGIEGSGDDYTAALVFAPATNSWALDYTATSFLDAPAKIYMHTGSEAGSAVGLFIQSAAQPPGTAPTSFARILAVNPICSDYTVLSSGSNCGALTKVGLQVTSVVHWFYAGRERVITLEERLFDWR